MLKKAGTAVLAMFLYVSILVQPAVADESRGRMVYKSTNWSEVLQQARIMLEGLIDDYPDDYLWSDVQDHSEIHRCQILSQIVGFGDVADNLAGVEIPFRGDFEQSELFEKGDRIASLYYWITTAESILSLSDLQIVSEWNTNCIGRELFSDPYSASKSISGSYYVENTGQLEEFVRRDGQRLVVVAPIEVGFYEKLVGVLNASKDIRFVELASGGGSVSEAIQAGLEIRRRGLSTVVTGDCRSACPLVFAGGLGRYVEVGGRLGFHRIFSNSTGCASSIDDPIYALTYAYLNEMDISPDVFLSYMHKAQPTTFEFPSHMGLCEGAVANFVFGFCTHDSLAPLVDKELPEITRYPVPSEMFMGFEEPQVIAQDIATYDDLLDGVFDDGDAYFAAVRKIGQSTRQEGAEWDFSPRSPELVEEIIERDFKPYGYSEERLEELRQALLGVGVRKNAPEDPSCVREFDVQTRKFNDEIIVPWIFAAN